MTFEDELFHHDLKDLGMNGVRVTLNKRTERLLGPPKNHSVHFEEVLCLSGKWHISMEIQEANPSANKRFGCLNFFWCGGGGYKGIKEV